MSIARRPRRMFAALLALFLIGGVLIPTASADVPAAMNSASDGPDFDVAKVRSWAAGANDPGGLLAALDTYSSKLPLEFAERLDHTSRGLLRVMVSVAKRDVLVEDFIEDATTWVRWYFDNPRFYAAVTPDQLKTLLASPVVMFVEPDVPLTYFMSASTIDVHARSLAGDGTGVWSFDATAGPKGALRSDIPGLTVDQATGKGVTVAITDSGIDRTFRDFGGWDCTPGPYAPCENRILRAVTTEHLIGGPDLGDELPTTEAASGHGSHVSGTVAGNGYYARDGGEDAATYGADGIPFGVAPQANLIMTKNGDTLWAGLSQFGLEWQLENAAEYGIRVSSNSWGCLGGCSFNGSSATGRLFKDMYTAGIVTVFAAGNDGGTQAGTTFSGNAQSPYVLGVAAYKNEDHRLASFSSRGSDNTVPEAATWTPESEPVNGERRPDVAAPGVDIWSARTLTGGAASGVPRQSTADAIGGQGCCIRDYAIMGGTSMATPHVAGAAALVFSACPSAKPLDAMRAIMATAGSDILKTTGATLAQPFEVGYGGLEVRAAVDWLTARNCDSSNSGGGTPDPSPSGSPTPSPSPTPSSTPTPRAVGEVVFAGEGFIEASSGPTGVTLGDFLINCSEPVTQGLDGYAFELPQETSGEEVVTLIGSGSAIPHDLDVYFYDSGCSASGDGVATESPDEIAFVPNGTKWIFAHAFTGLETTANVTVYSGEEGPAPTPTAPPTPTSSATPPGPGGPTLNYYFHSESLGVHQSDQLTGDNTFDAVFPTLSDAESVDTPIIRGVPFDSQWKGVANVIPGGIGSLTVDFYYRAPVLPAPPSYDISIKVGAAPEVLLPRLDVTPTGAAIGHATHTFTGLDIQAAGQTVTVTFASVNALAPTGIVFDSPEHPSGFMVDPGGSPTPSGSPTTPPTESPTATPTPTQPPAECGSYPTTPDDSLWIAPGVVSSTSGGQWGMRKIKAPQAWQEQQATGCGIKVAVLDTGIDLGAENTDLHPDFGCPGKVEIVPGSDIIEGDDVPNDEHGHGTHVAGIVGACTNNGEGVAGVAPDATILPVRVLDEGGSGDAEGLAQGIRLAADSGAHVINMSLGFLSALAPVELVDQVFPEIDAAIEYARSKGVVVVAAAGNETFPICAVPAIAEDVICVGSSDTRDLNSWFGNFPVKHDQDEDVGPGLLAPGGSGTFGIVACEQTDEEIISTWLRAGDGCGEQGYQAISGTSMASPHVAGAAALVYNRLNGARSAANGRAVIDAIIENAEDLYAPGYDPPSGYGRVDALAAVTSVDPVAPPPVALGTTVEFTSAAGGNYSDEATIAARLVDEDGNTIEGADLAFKMTGEDGEEGAEQWTVVTDADGIGSATRVLTRDPGTYVLTVHYAGETDVYEPDSDQQFFVIDKEQTVTTLDVTGKGKNRKLTASLTEDDGPALGGRGIVFFADGTEIGRATTNTDGIAVLEAPPGYRGDRFNFEARFAGTENYRESSGSDQT